MQLSLPSCCQETLLNRIAWDPEMSVSRYVNSGSTNSAEKIRLPHWCSTLQDILNVAAICVLTSSKEQCQYISAYLKGARQIMHPQLPCAVWRFVGRRVRILQIFVAAVACRAFHGKWFRLEALSIFLARRVDSRSRLSRDGRAAETVPSCVKFGLYDAPNARVRLSAALHERSPAKA